MLKNIVKGFVEMMSAIREECVLPCGNAQTDWERDAFINLIEVRAGIR